MTPENLQDDLIRELEKLFTNYKYRNSFGIAVPLKIYPQGLPLDESDDEDDPIPYIIVRINDGLDAGGSEDNNIVNLVVIAGIYDNDKSNQGHRSILNIINTLYSRFAKDPMLSGKYMFAGNFKWVVQEDGYFPYFFGAVEMSFNIPRIRREDIYT